MHAAVGKVMNNIGILVKGLVFFSQEKLRLQD